MELLDRLFNEEEFPIIASYAYLSNQTGVVYVGYLVDNNQVLPFVIRKHYFVKWIQLYTEVLNCESEEQERLFLNKCMEYMKNHYNVSHIMCSNTALFKSYPKGSDCCKWGTYKVDLRKEESELFSNLHSKHRNVIRKAESLGLVVKHGKDYANVAVELMNDTYRRQGSKYTFGKHYIQNMNLLGENADWWVVYDKDGNPQGSAVFVWREGSSCYYIHGGSCAHTAQGAMNLLIWQAMLTMKSRRVVFFDFVGARVTTIEGSKLEGIQRFKSRFGSTLEQGYMFRYVVNKSKYYIYNICMNSLFLLKGKKHYKDIIDQERERGNY